MKLKRLAALLLCAAVMLPLAACAKKPDSGTSRTSQTTDDTTVTPTKDGDTPLSPRLTRAIKVPPRRISCRA